MPVIVRPLAVMTVAVALVATAAASEPTAAPAPLEGVPLVGRTGLRLLIANNPPLLLDVDTGRVSDVSGTGADASSVLTVHPVGRDAVVWIDRALTATRFPEAGIYVVRRGATAATRLASASEVAASADGAAVWLKSFAGGRRCSLREVRLDGSRRRDPRSVSCDAHLVDAGAGAVLVAGRTVRDPGSRAVVLAGAQLEAMTDDVAVTTETPGPIGLTRLSTGRHWTLRWPSRIGLGSQGGMDRAAVSYDGARIALAFSDPAYGGGGTQVTDVWLLDARARRFHHVPDLPAAVSLKLTSMQWARDGRLVLLAETGGRTVVGVWRPGQKRIGVRPVRLPLRTSGSDAFVVW